VAKTPINTRMSATLNLSTRLEKPANGLVSEIGQLASLGLGSNSGSKALWMLGVACRDRVVAGSNSGILISKDALLRYRVVCLSSWKSGSCSSC
jgi:hypothetical protein